MPKQVKGKGVMEKIAIVLSLVILLTGVCMAEECNHKSQARTLEYICPDCLVERHREAGDSSLYLDTEANTQIFSTTPLTAPSTAITMNAPDGRSATIDFGGEQIEYSGDLPVAESARIFFDAIFSIYKKELNPHAQ